MARLWKNWAERHPEFGFEGPPLVAPLAKLAANSKAPARAKAIALSAAQVGRWAQAEQFQAGLAPDPDCKH
eukprot:2093374-Lingulodinium_polyedra.AAC.1